MRSNLHGLADASWGISKTGWPEIFGRTKKPLLTVIFFSLPYSSEPTPSTDCGTQRWDHCSSVTVDKMEGTPQPNLSDGEESHKYKNMLDHQHILK